MTRTASKKKHDHRQSIWIVGCSAEILWCYRCGAWRWNRAGREAWNKPVGLNGKNPALKGR